MVVKKETQDKILKIISDKPNGATIIEIEKELQTERHTLSKYLVYMQGLGLISHKAVGKAKIWHINKAPARTIFRKNSAQKPFAENLLLNIVEHIPIGFVMLDKHYTIDHANEFMQEKYGELDGQNFYQTVLGLENPLKIEVVSKVIDGRQRLATFQINDREGNVLEIKAAKIENPDGTTGALLLIDDITESRKTENRLRMLSSAIEQTGDIVLITDRAGNIEYVNSAFEFQTGYRREEVLGKNPKLLQSGKHKKSFYENMWKTVLAGKTYRGLFINKKKNGKLYYERKTITPINGERRSISHFVSIGKDVTEPIRTLKKTRSVKDLIKY